MKASLIVAVSLAALAVLAPQRAHAEEISLTVYVENVRPGAGMVRIAVFNEQSWLEAPVIARQTDGDSARVTLALTAPSAGRYGIAAYQDVNGDGELNRGFLGIPSEPYAFSNNAGRFGPPNFADAAIDLVAPASTVITLR